MLLVTDMTAKEFVFGKLGGVFYNTKEMVLLPMALLFTCGPSRRDLRAKTCYICWAVCW